MEPVNSHHQHHHHQPQEQLPIGSSSSPSSSLASQSSSYGGSSISQQYSWTTTPTITSDNDELSQNYNGFLSNSRPKDDHHNIALASPNSSMVQGWSGNHNEHKGEVSMNELSEKLLLKTISSGFPMFPTTVNDFSSFNRPSFTQIYPSVNVSSLSQQASSSRTNPSSLGMNLQALDLLSSARFGGSFPRQQAQRGSYGTNLAAAGVFENSHGTLDLHQLQLRSQLKAPYNPINDICSSALITNESNRGSCLAEPPGGAAAKKPRLDSRPSCPPFKVRKEKLGDRIAALQQLVAPFGKTDTASVLMEAIGYIKFLQNQVETLSVPYMKLSSRKKDNCRSKGGLKTEDSNEGSSRDLRSRGLCLVPISCMSYVTNDSGGGIWPPPGYGGPS